MADKNMIGDRLYYLRLKANLTMKVLSKNINMSEGHISEIESGKSLPSMKTLKKICEFYNISLADFFNNNVTLSHLTEEQQNLILLTENMKEEQIQHLNQFIQMCYIEHKK